MTSRTPLASPAADEELPGPVTAPRLKKEEPNPPSSLSVEHVRTLTQLRDALPEWQTLYAASGVFNPFINPLWVLAWIEHYVEAEDLDVLFVRANSELVGVAPFCRSPVRVLRGLKPVRIQLLGNDGKDDLTELTEPLVLPQRSRAILRAIVAEVASRDDWDWLELPLSAEQGWIETQWWPMNGRHPRFVALHKATVASVILDLGTDDTAVPLKRNMRRILRHRHNQLDRQQAVVEVQRLDGRDQLADGIRILCELHAARSAMTDVPRHPDMLVTARSRAFLAQALIALANAGNAAIYVLRIDQRAVAVQLVLIANGCYYLALSGIDPTAWQLSPLTLLTSSVIDDAKTRGAKRVNLSTGPNTAKLAWSETLEFHQYFLIVRRAPLSSLRFSAYWQARSLNRFWHEYSQQRRQCGK
jgi:CelD/BcsL family acetyltransferase involved in cellulose biosynthesis